MSGAMSTYALSPLQHGMLFHHVQSPWRGVDVEQLDGTLHETLDVDAFARAWGEVAARHEVLRTCFRWEGLEWPQQEVADAVVVPFKSHDLRALSVAEKEARLASFLVDDRRRGFDLAAAPCFRVTL